MYREKFTSLMIVGLLTVSGYGQERQLKYVRKPTRHETIVATLRASGYPAFDGPWYFIGPFDNVDGVGFRRAYPPEREINLKKQYPGKNGPVRWHKYDQFRLGKINHFTSLFDDKEYGCVYVYTEIMAKEPTAMTLSMGSDDSIVVWINGQEVHRNEVHRAAAPDQDQVRVSFQAGRNRLLIKVCNDDGLWSLYLRPKMEGRAEAQFARRLGRDFGGVSAQLNQSLLAAEEKHYRIVTIPIPPEIVLEVGGLAFRPDGKLLCCTRRGDVWLIDNATADDPSRVRFHLFASGLHEPLGLHVDGDDVYVVQRPELTRLRDTDDDDVADVFETICDAWGVSGDYHEFAFGPARDRQGNFYVTLNVGFAGGHQSKVPWRGWCVRISPEGRMTPIAAGLRSPNGINFSPQGDLFYCDNQGEWVATCKMHHIRPGDYYGHQASLRWAADSPFASRLPREGHPSGMRYDGGPGRNGVSGMPPLDPPCIWFPYDRMGKSASEPVWDTTQGKFGPFAGQCFVGDQTNSSIMRVYLEKVGGKYQGACFPFRLGFECGVNRLAFAPDGSLLVGMTNRGWGSLGGKPYGLQRLVYTGRPPFEVYSMSLTETGFELTFTEPVDRTTAARVQSYSIQSHTYYYWPTYGSPEVDRRNEVIERVSVSADGKRVQLTVPRLVRGRVYSLFLDGVRSQAGLPLVHGEAYYTLNQLRQSRR